MIMKSGTKIKNVKERDLFDRPEEDGSIRHWKREEKAGKELQRADCGKEEGTEGFLSFIPNKTSYTMRRRR
jgi:hypothetical protein